MTNHDAEITIQRSHQFKVNAVELGDFIRALPLSTQQNDSLIALITKQVTEAEGTAFRFGFDMGVKLAKRMPGKPVPPWVMG